MKLARDRKDREEAGMYVDVPIQVREDLMRLANLQIPRMSVKGYVRKILVAHVEEHMTPEVRDALERASRAVAGSVG